MVGGALSQIFKSLLFGWLLSFGTKKMKSVAANELNADLQILADLLDAGKIKPVIERYYPLDQAGAAMDYVSRGHAAGKVVVRAG